MVGRILCVPRDYLTLQDAMQFVEDEDCISISSGEYMVPPNTHIGLTKNGVHILADDDGGHGPTIVLSPGCVFFVEASECRIEGVCFRGTAVPPLTLVSLACDGHCALDKVTIELIGCVGVALLCAAGTKATLTDCRIAGESTWATSSTRGIVLGVGSFCRIQRGLIERVGVGLLFNPSADGLISESQVRSCSTGVFVSAGCTPRFEFVHFEECREVGVDCQLDKSMANPVQLTANRFSRCGTGARSSMTGTIVMLRNHIEDCAIGIEATQGSTLTMKTNVLLRNGIGVDINTGAKPELVDNLLEDSTQCHLRMKGLGTTADITGNMLTMSGGAEAVGLLVTDQANPALQRNTFEGHYRPIVVGENGHARLRGNIIRNTMGDAAIRIKRNATIVVEDCIVQRCQGSAAVVESRGSISLLRNTVSGCNLSAFVFEGQSTGEVRKNVLKDIPQGWLYFPCGAWRDGVRCDQNISEGAAVMVGD